MAHDPVAARYAQALLQAAKAKQEVEPLRGRLNQLKGLLVQQPVFGRFLNDPGVRTDEKIALLKKALSGEASKTLEAFLQMVVAFGRAELLASIGEAYSELVDEDQGLVRAVVRSVHPLDASSRTRLHQRLEPGAQLRYFPDVQLALEHAILDALPIAFQDLHDLGTPFGVADIVGDDNAHDDLPGTL